MNAAVSTVRELRAEHRHELRTLTYLTVDQATGGVIRNLNQKGISAQMLKTLRTGEQVRLRFELRAPKIRVETVAEVVWTTGSGQCGMRFLNLPASMRLQINEWILNDLLEAASLHAERSESIFGRHLFEINRPDEIDSAEESIPCCEEDDGLVISGTPAKVITLPLSPEPPRPEQDSLLPLPPDEVISLDWLSRSLSPRAIARVIDMLAVVASFFLFVLVFLSVTGEAPPAPFAMAAAGLALVTVIYWGFFWVFGGESLGSRLARKARLQEDSKEQSTAD
jgi:hypothetical protein